MARKLKTEKPWRVNPASGVLTIDDAEGHPIARMLRQLDNSERTLVHKMCQVREMYDMLCELEQRKDVTDLLTPVDLVRLRETLMKADGLI